jgi:hypothetical protein
MLEGEPEEGGVGVGVEVGVRVGVGVGVGEGDGDDVGVAVADGELDGLAGAELPWAGPTRFGVCAGW